MLATRILEPLYQSSLNGQRPRELIGFSWRHRNPSTGQWCSTWLPLEGAPSSSQYPQCWRVTDGSPDVPVSIEPELHCWVCGLAGSYQDGEFVRLLNRPEDLE